MALGNNVVLPAGKWLNLGRLNLVASWREGGRKKEKESMCVCAYVCVHTVGDSWTV